jgi:hypothetical protein
LLPIIFLLLCGCAAENEIQMREMPLKLTAVEKSETGDIENLTLKWQSLDGYINVITNAPAKDSGEYVIGSVYARCFLKR